MLGCGGPVYGDELNNDAEGQLASCCAALPWYPIVPSPPPQSGEGKGIVSATDSEQNEQSQAPNRHHAPNRLAGIGNARPAQEHTQLKTGCHQHNKLFTTYSFVKICLCARTLHHGRDPMSWSRLPVRPAGTSPNLEGKPNMHGENSVSKLSEMIVRRAVVAVTVPLLPPGRCPRPTVRPTDRPTHRRSGLFWHQPYPIVPAALLLSSSELVGVLLIVMRVLSHQHHFLKLA